MGVVGGLPLMVLFIAVLVSGLFFVGQTLRHAVDLPSKSRFMIWALGASLFAHVVTFISVSYYDQSFLFIYLTLALISSTSTAVSVADTIHQYNLAKKIVNEQVQV
jgi:hypothetical protein